MAMRSEPESFGHFFRRYTKTWMHAVATAGLTAFGALTFVHRGFVVVAIACYVVPPVVLYLSRSRGSVSGASGDGTASPTDAALNRGAEPDGDSGESVRTRTPEGEPSASEAQSAPDRGSASRESRTEPRDESTAKSTETGDESTAESAETDDHDRESVPTPNAGRESAAATSEGVSETDTGSEPVPTTDASDATPEPGPTGSSADAARDDAERAADSSERDADGESGTEAPGERQDAGDESDAVPDWTVVDSPTDATLFDVAVTDDRAVAVGGGGVVLESGDDDWGVLLEDGPGAQGQNLHGVDATADGEVVWMAGDGGAVGRLETATGRHTDHSAPDDRTDNLAGLAVAGASGDETVLLIDGSGEVVRGRYRDGEPSWDEPVKPGGGSSLSGVTLADTVGYCCDTNDGVFETDDGGRTFETVGLEGADGTLTDIVAGGRDDCHASTDAGVVHRYDGSTWTPERVCEGALTGIDRHDERFVVCDADGTVYDRIEPTADWERFDAGVSGGLESVATGASRAVAVGADGTIVERG